MQQREHEHLVAASPCASALLQAPGIVNNAGAVSACIIKGAILLAAILIDTLGKRSGLPGFLRRAT